MFMDKGDNLKLKIGKIRSFEEANKTIEIPLIKGDKIIGIPVIFIAYYATVL